jgi:hypothetical protein
MKGCTGLLLPLMSDMTKCYCGAIINNKTSGEHILACHIEAA